MNSQAVGFIDPNTPVVVTAESSSLTYTAPYNGICYFKIYAPYNGFTTTFSINNTVIQPAIATSHTNNYMWFQPVPLLKGQTITFGTTKAILYFAKCMTAN